MLGFHFDATALGGRAMALTSSQDVSDGGESNLFFEDQAEGTWQSARAKVVNSGHHEAAGLDGRVPRNIARIQSCAARGGRNSGSRPLAHKRASLWPSAPRRQA